MKAISIVCLLALLGAAIAAGCSQIHQSHQAPQVVAVKDPPPVAPAAQGSAGITVYKDPKTGRFVPVPQEGAAELSKALGDALSTSQEGLVEVPAPGGGFMVDLRGRFQSATMATVAADGTVTVHCGESVKKEQRP